MVNLQTIKNYFCPKGETEEWMKMRIDDVATEGKRILKAQIEADCGVPIEYALQKGFDVTVISGEPSSSEEKKSLAELLELYPNNFNFHTLHTRPEPHYAIIDKHLFVEVPHRENAITKKGIGVTETYEWILKGFYKKFDDSLKNARKITREELVYT
ncbi:MAG: hypothetical protein WA139_00325 [Candidatus Aenigmatarchaeota archaeon]